MMRTGYLKIAIVFVFALTLSACIVKSPYYQKQVGIPGTQWSSKFQPKFSIDIPDTNHNYITYLLIRHTDDYPYSNIWINMKIKAPGEPSFDTTIKIEKQLADASGKWLAKGMGNIREHKIPLSFKEIPPFTKAGNYIIQLEQIMRNDPLPCVLNVGMCVEKVAKVASSK
jgi:gliding motility-associated lipoprotein GldH